MILCLCCLCCWLRLILVCSCLDDALSLFFHSERQWFQVFSVFFLSLLLLWLLIENGWLSTERASNLDIIHINYTFNPKTLWKVSSSLSWRMQPRLTFLFIYLFVSLFFCMLSNYTFMKSCPTCLQFTHILTSICIVYCCPHCFIYMYIYICIYISPTCMYILAPCLPLWSSILHKHTQLWTKNNKVAGHEAKTTS